MSRSHQIDLICHTSDRSQYIILKPSIIGKNLPVFGNVVLELCQKALSHLAKSGPDDAPRQDPLQEHRHPPKRSQLQPLDLSFRNCIDIKFCAGDLTNQMHQKELVENPQVRNSPSTERKTHDAKHHPRALSSHVQSRCPISGPRTKHIV